MTTTYQESIGNLFECVGLPSHHLTPQLEVIAHHYPKYLKDLRINVNNVLQYEHLTKKEALLLAYSVATNERNYALVEGLSNLAKQEKATEEELAEIAACVSLMNINNVFYRFRHFTNQDFYNQTQAGIKMSIMMKPVVGKEFFELVSLAISAINGCEMCVNAHEQSVKQHGGTQQRIYDAIRLAAVIKGLCVIS